MSRPRYKRKCKSPEGERGCGRAPGVGLRRLRGRGAGRESAHLNFESKPSRPRDWRSRPDAAGLVFRRGDAYLSYAAVAREAWRSANCWLRSSVVRDGASSWCGSATRPTRTAPRRSAATGLSKVLRSTRGCSSSPQHRTTAPSSSSASRASRSVLSSNRSSKARPPRPRPARRPAPSWRGRGAVEKRDRQKERAERERERRADGRGGRGPLRDGRGPRGRRRVRGGGGGETTTTTRRGHLRRRSGVAV